MQHLRTTFGQVVREYREKQGLSQEDLAALAGVHRTYVSSIELGKVGPGLEVLHKIAMGLSIPLSDLISETEIRFQERFGVDGHNY